MPANSRLDLIRVLKG